MTTSFAASSNSAIVNVPASTNTVLVESDPLPVGSKARITGSIVQIADNAWDGIAYIYQGAGAGGTLIATIVVNSDTPFTFLVEDDSPVTQYTLVVESTSTMGDTNGILFVDQIG